MVKTISGEEHKEMIQTTQVRRFGGFPLPVGLVVAAIILVGLGFMGGVAYQKGRRVPTTTASNQNTATNSPGQMNPNGFGGRRFNGQRPVRGQVTAVSDTSITINDMTGASHTYAISANTTITNQTQTATTSDIKTGDMVAIIVDSANSQNAARILINPTFGGGPSSTNGPNSTTMSQ